MLARINVEKKIQTSGNLLLNLIDYIINIAKSESGVLKIAPGETFAVSYNTKCSIMPSSWAWSKTRLEQPVTYYKAG